ncbi:pyridoxamine 5'-phosphate oxidase family protein [Polaribacter uvawellassae]|uniref:pyridoxamine 5'-phosphate oxidase family protein n=1 Tax=Polaribacter uvawellassae TaxID=3133495 RepID=UPI003219E5DC
MIKKLLFLFTLFCVSFIGVSQTKNTTFSKIELIKAAKEIMNSTGTCALITQDKNGISRARTMDPFPPDENLTVWFGTNTTSRKVAQIKQNNLVTIYYRDNDDSGYVMLHGKATLVNNPQEKKKYWKETWKSFYPNKKENYTLIKVVPIWMEIVSPPRNIVGNSETWEPPMLFFKSKK